jgi:hypothetical protein
LSQRHVLLGFVALNPTYIWPLIFERRNPTMADFESEPTVSFSIWSAVFWAGGDAET